MNTELNYLSYQNKSYSSEDNSASNISIILDLLKQTYRHTCICHMLHYCHGICHIWTYFEVSSAKLDIAPFNIYLKWIFLSSSSSRPPKSCNLACEQCSAATDQLSFNCSKKSIASVFQGSSLDSFTSNQLQKCITFSCTEIKFWF